MGGVLSDIVGGGFAKSVGAIFVPVNLFKDAIKYKRNISDKRDKEL